LPTGVYPSSLNHLIRFQSDCKRDAARGTGAKYQRHQMNRDEWQQQAAVILREQHDIRPLDIR
jgi:hypothetical protein